MAAFMTRYLNDKGKRVLCIDADPDENFSGALGVKHKKSLGDVRELFQDKTEKIFTQSSKQKWFDSKIFEATVEEDLFDLIVMGRPEGEGCYCYVNHLIRKVIDGTTKSYDYAIVDCEPGLEHLSRRTTANVDFMVVVTDQSKKSLETVERIEKLAKSLDVEFGSFYVVSNRIEKGTEKLVEKQAKAEGVKIDFTIYEDPEVRKLDLKGGSPYKDAKKLRAYKEFLKLAEKIGL